MKRLWVLFTIMAVLCLSNAATASNPKTAPKSNNVAKVQKLAVSPTDHYLAPIEVKRQSGQPASVPFPDAAAPAPVTDIGLLNGTRLDPGGFLPYLIAKGDFDGDGKLDIATVAVSPLVAAPESIVTPSSMQSPLAIMVLLGKGDGTFGDPIVAARPGTTPVKLIPVDLDKDGKTDLIVIRAEKVWGDVTKVRVEVMLSNGDGTFKLAQTEAFPCLWDDFHPTYALGDFNGDTNIDLAIEFAGEVVTFWGDGKGTFKRCRDYKAYSQNDLRVPELADLDGDGLVDVVGETTITAQDGVQQNALVVIMGTLDGFAAPTHYLKGVAVGDAHSLIVADVNGDGKPDVVSLNSDQYTVSVFLQLPGKPLTFNAALPPVFAGDFPNAAVVADANNDGIVDLVLTNSDAGNVAILQGKGDGTFKNLIAYEVGGFPIDAAVVGDFNGDKVADIAIANFMWDVVYLQGTGGGEFRAAQHAIPLPTALDRMTDFYSYATSIAVADFNGDGIPDVVTGNDADDHTGLTVYMGDKKANLSLGTNVGSGGQLYYVAAGDLNGDKIPDLVASDASDNSIKIFLGKGDGTFAAPLFFPANGASQTPYQLALVDVNGDGALDVIVRNDSLISILFNDGTGHLTLTQSSQYPLNHSGERLAIADVNGDGKFDILALYEHGVEILLNMGKDPFMAATDHRIGNWDFEFRDIAVGDFDGDGKIDLALSARAKHNLGDFRASKFEKPEGVVVAFGRGDGTFQDSDQMFMQTTRPDNWPMFAAPGGVTAVDLNADGKLDIAVANNEFGTVAVLFNTGSAKVPRAFADAAEFLAANFGSQFAITDMNKDGAPDLVMSSNDMGVSVLLNTGGTKFTVTSSAANSHVGDIVTITGTLTPTVRGMTKVPSGGIDVRESGASIGYGEMDGGKASVDLAKLTAGTHNLTLQYEGDTKYIPMSAALAQVVLGPEDYGIGWDKTSSTVTAGQSAGFRLTVTPQNGFGGAVTLACSAPDKGMSCSFSSATITGSGTATLSVKTTSTTLAMLSLPARRGSTQPTLLATLMATGAVGVLFAGASFRKRWIAVLMSLVLVGIFVTIVACGNGSHPTQTPVVQTNPNATTAGTHTVVVTTTSGAITHSTNLSVIVQ